MALQERQLENNWYYVPDPPGLASLRNHGGLLRYILPAMKHEDVVADIQ